VLLKWSRISFLGGCPTSKPWTFGDVEYVLFHKCGEEWTMRYALGTAVSNYRRVRPLRNGNEVNLEPFARGLPRPSGKILGDAATIGWSGGMC
jgi:hypothetical protein